MRLKAVLVLAFSIALHAQTSVISGSGTGVIGGGSGAAGPVVPVSTGSGQGFFQAYYGRTSVAGGGGSIVIAANTAQCRAFYLPFTRTVTSGYFYVTSASATSTVDAGLYSMAGALLANLGGIATTTASNTLYGGAITQGSVTLQGATYYYGCVAGAVVSYPVVAIQSSAASGFDTPANGGGVLLTGTFTAGISNGVLPPTMGTLTNSVTFNHVIVWWY